MRIPYFLLFILSFLWASPALPVPNASCAQHILIAEAAPPIEPSKPKPIEPKKTKKAKKKPNFGIDWEEFGWVLLALLGVMILGYWYGRLFVDVFGALAAGTLAALPMSFFILMVSVAVLASLGFVLWGVSVGVEEGPIFYTAFFSVLSILLGYVFLLAGIGISWLWWLGFALMLVGLAAFVGVSIFGLEALEDMGEAVVFSAALLIFMGGLLTFAIGRLVVVSLPFIWTAGVVGVLFLLLLIGAIILAKYYAS